jgi:hypothetical protein
MEDNDVIKSPWTINSSDFGIFSKTFEIQIKIVDIVNVYAPNVVVKEYGFFHKGF